MKISKAKLRQIIKEELGTSRKPDWSALDQAFSSYLVEYIKAAELAQGEEELNDLWDHTTAQLRDLTDAESFRAHGRMSAGSTASRKPRKLGEENEEGLTMAFDPQAILAELESAAHSIGMHGDTIDRLAATDSDVWKVSSELFAVARALEAVSGKLSDAINKPRTR